MSATAAQSTAGKEATTKVVSKGSMQKPIALVERRTLLRDCLVRCLQEVEATAIMGFPNAAVCVDEIGAVPPSLVILSASGCASDHELSCELSELSNLSSDIPVVIVSDQDGLDSISTALERGTRGYIPTTHSFDIAVEALRLVRAGGVYVPASALTDFAKRASRNADEPQTAFAGLFTPRQSAVVEAIRKGKPNKIIAYELNMCESTVKVHVRTIMKKLKAKNRTEVAFLASSILDGQIAPSRTLSANEPSLLKPASHKRIKTQAKAGAQPPPASTDGLEATPEAETGIPAP
jgi:DNA-binding NarL/FixJ family response regulator